MRGFAGSIKSLCIYPAICIAALAAGRARADRIDAFQSFAVSNQSVNDGQYLADATITFGLSADRLTVSLDNTSTMHAANELIRSVSFQLTGGRDDQENKNGGAVQIISLDNGRQETVDKNGSYRLSNVTLDGLADPWRITRNNGIYTLTTSGSKDLVIAGPTGNVYSATGSIDGNRGHNPFLADTPTFTLKLCGIHSVTRVQDVRVGFGTESLSVPAIPTATPEPATLGLLSLGGLGLLARRRRRAKVES